jgi:uncharacterized protein (TIGR03118 family)
MTRRSIRIASLATAAGGIGLCLAFAAPASLVSFYSRTVLLSDGAVDAPTTDTNLVNPWGLASSGAGPFWIASEGGATASIVRADGSLVTADVLVPGDQSARPTGLVFNGGGGFPITQDGITASSLFLFVTLEGRVLGWNPNVDPAHAVVAVENDQEGDAYTGAALAMNGGQRFLYVANFGAGTVEVFDTAFVPVGSFTDADLPAGHAPFGIAAIAGDVFVTFVPRDAATGSPVPGPGHGFVDQFAPDGTLKKRLISQGELDLPWGLVVAPSGFGRFSRKLLVGNFGDGRILAFNPHRGHLQGQLEDEVGQPIVNDGLWGLQFGNGGIAGDVHDLYFTAGIGNEAHGVFGRIEVGR